MEARSLAIRRLSVREHSAAELKAYLERKECDPAEVEAVIAEMIAEGLLDDSRYARAITRHHIARGKGPRYVAAALARKGVRIDTRAARDLVTDASDVSELELASRVVARHYPGAAEDEKIRHRAFQGLLRRGFSHEIARACLLQKRSSIE